MSASEKKKKKTVKSPHTRFFEQIKQEMPIIFKFRSRILIASEQKTSKKKKPHMH